MKVLIIGLDGGDWQVFRPLIERGDMPALRRLAESGAGGVLWSTIPDITPVAWSSFQTGLVPERHGALDFVTYGGETLINASTVKGTTIWEWASRQDRRVIAVNVPVTYPPRPVQGIIVGGLFSPASAKDFVSPPEIAQELDAATGGYTLLEGQRVFRHHDVTTDAGLGAFVEAMRASARMRARAGAALMANHPWDLCMVHLQEVDAFQHPVWPYLDPGSRHFDERRHRVAAEFYREVDRGIQALVEAAGPAGGVRLVLMSDHGFQPTDRILFLNRWLYREGFLELTADWRSRIAARAVRWGSALDRFELRRHVYRRLVPRALKTRAYHYAEGGLGRIDRTRSRAYAVFRAHRDYALLQAPSGDPGVLADLEAALRRARDPETGEPMIEDVQRGRDVYARGRPGDALPDLVVRTRYGYAATASFTDPDGPTVVTPVFGKEYGIGQHRREGMFVLAGPGIAAGQRLDAHIVDLTPTILHLMGLAVPPGLDGRVLRAAFEDPLARRPVRRLEAQPAGSAPERYDFSPAEDAEVRRQLRELGYLE